MRFIWLTCFLIIGFTGCTPYKSCQEVREEHMVCDMDFLYEHTCLPNRLLTLTDIIEIAWARNLDTLVKEQEWIIQREVATSEALKMLPRLDFTGELSHRNKNTAARSETLEPVEFLGPPQISQEQSVRIWDITLAWNALDFGLAYFRSQAESNRAITFYFQYARLKQNLILEVYRSYWKAMVNLVGMIRSQKVIEASKVYRQRLNRQIGYRNLSQVIGLRFEDQMLTVQLRFYSFKEAYNIAKAELAALMGTPANIPFDLAVVQREPIPILSDINLLENIALESRPELFGSDFTEKLSIDEVRFAILQLFPSVEFFRGYHENRDKFLVHHHWILAGFRAAWNLFSIPSRAFAIKAARIRLRQARYERLALSVGVLSQVHIARWLFEEQLELYNLQSDISSTRQNLSNATFATFLAGEFNMLDAINAESDAVLSEVNAMQAYGDLQVAMEQLNNAIGKPLYFNTLPIEDEEEVEQEEVEQEIESYVQTIP